MGLIPTLLVTISCSSSTKRFVMGCLKSLGQSD